MHIKVNDISCGIKFDKIPEFDDIFKSKDGSLFIYSIEYLIFDAIKIERNNMNIKINILLK